MWRKLGEGRQGDLIPSFFGFLSNCRGPGVAEAYQRAIGLESDPAVRRFLQERHAALTARAH